jgi:hypothetical protein
VVQGEGVDSPDGLHDDSTPANSGAYQDPAAALKDIGEAFNFWSGSLGSKSLQICYALIGANWVVYGSTQGLLQSGWAILSLLSILCALAQNILVAFVMAELHRTRYAYAEKDKDRWADEFTKFAGTSHAWPFTRTIEVVGILSRWLNFLLPTFGALFLFIGACTR